MTNLTAARSRAARSRADAPAGRLAGEAGSDHLREGLPAGGRRGRRPEREPAGLRHHVGGAAGAGGGGSPDDEPRRASTATSTVATTPADSIRTSGSIPTKLATIAAAVADRLAAIDPDQRREYRANAERLRTELTDLDDDFRSGLTGCQRTEFITAHTAFGYLAKRYGLTQIGITRAEPGRRAVTGPDRRHPARGPRARGDDDLHRDPGVAGRRPGHRRRSRSADRRSRSARGHHRANPGEATTLRSCAPT